MLTNANLIVMIEAKYYTLYRCMCCQRVLVDKLSKILIASACGSD